MTEERQIPARPGTDRAGVPQWKTGKPDAMLAAAVDVARRELETVTGPGTIGGHLGAKREEDRVVTHLFESRLRGYGGWTWFAVLTRNSRSKTITVSEVGLLPSEDSVLAPPWVPWSERVRPEDVAAMEAAQAADAAAESAHSDAGEPGEAAEPEEGGPAEPSAVDADDDAPEAGQEDAGPASSAEEDEPDEG
ncbi:MULTISPECIES: DUF3027 domain-containing protein [Arthrobacter]|uniref:DUF3027 domain-containing protein n=2 Tax=Arthrobacter TaxID=1663 RepID=A0ABU9KLS4_9MICC|nr:DUF3027 domain-containing protein [Arthrobacter sp. YJM1]MDP5227757.1 DUF3027 domain-containing protein [Arthrobacter sp. YJM1]